VARAAAEVAAHIGVSRAQAPREVVARLVAYFRSFVDSDEFPTDRDDVYLALALSKKGVCRHRAFAFLVTALGLGLPVRMIANEAHAWVEVNDGSLWRRIDLGGAGRALDASLAGG
jgi:transglutaminase-like putative cysteine protease